MYSAQVDGMHGHQPGHMASYTFATFDILVMHGHIGKQVGESTDPPATSKPIGKALLDGFCIIIIFSSGLSGF